MQRQRHYRASYLGWFYFAHLDDPLARQIAYPFNYKEEVMAAAEKEQVPPSLVASVILAESKYKIQRSLKQVLLD